MSTAPLRKLRLSLVLTLMLGMAFGVAYALAGSPSTLDTLWLRWLFAAFLAALGVSSVHIIRFFVLDVVFLRAQGHRAPALVHAVVSIGLYFVLGLLIAGGVFHQSLSAAIATRIRPRPVAAGRHHVVRTTRPSTTPAQKNANQGRSG